MDTDYMMMPELDIETVQPGIYQYENVPEEPPTFTFTLAPDSTSVTENTTRTPLTLTSDDIRELNRRFTVYTAPSTPQYYERIATVQDLTWSQPETTCDTVVPNMSFRGGAIFIQKQASEPEPDLPDGMSPELDEFLLSLQKKEG